MAERTLLTPFEVRLAEGSERALRSGAQLLEWWKERGAAEGGKLFPLLPESRDATMEGFFDQTEIDGKRTSVMGCLQTLRFSPQPAADLPEGSINDFIARNLFRISEWRHPNGLPGGFGYTPLLYKSGGQYAPYPQGKALHLGEVGPAYECLVLRVEIHDFLRCFPPLKRFADRLSSKIREAAYIVIEPGYMHGTFPLSSDVAVETDLGYSFIPLAVHPSFFGYGPGRFGTAIKLFRFAALKTGGLEVKLAFLSAPRSEKVLYIRGFDPVYGLFHLFDLLTLGKMRIRERVHDKFDFIMLRQHGQVHQDFITGLRSEWEGHRWTLHRAASVPSQHGADTPAG